MKKLSDIEQQPKPQGETCAKFAHTTPHGALKESGTVPTVAKFATVQKEGTYAKFAYMGHDGLQLYGATVRNFRTVRLEGEKMVESLTPINYMNETSATDLLSRIR